LKPKIPPERSSVIATEIDLSDLGYDIGDAVDCFFSKMPRVNETQFDPTLILGLPEMNDGIRKQ